MEEEESGTEEQLYEMKFWATVIDYVLVHGLRATAEQLVQPNVSSFRVASIVDTFNQEKKYFYCNLLFTGTVDYIVVLYCTQLKHSSVALCSHLCTIL